LLLLGFDFSHWRWGTAAYPAEFPADWLGMLEYCHDLDGRFEWPSGASPGDQSGDRPGNRRASILRWQEVSPARAFWVVFLPLVTASLYFELKGALLSAILMVAVQMGVTLSRALPRMPGLF